MSENASFSFRMERVSYKDRTLIYVDADTGRTLAVELEMSGVPQFHWIGVDTQLAKWSEPKGVAISPEDRAEILRRLAEWIEEQGLRIRLGPPTPMAMDAMRKDVIAAGFAVIRNADGTERWSRKKKGVIRRFLDLFK